ncbi:3-hydroxyacyl-CoA dehydrogenase [Gemmobacter aquaticus]|uniref:3-hydroxyacyl-CoA dehydrogenase n=1 Tax=Gemmobacter aquaticus TaxID=490185 RepID=A0A917YLB5_9RHOB|nr:3-hydroxyacyl-CoA dehydrogenase NAD-binding domain-containing protein [Gemmobacter aquaticus]GGO34524.1 3-hydroxyacyl-CoA dehydrogenase [Gemmobacter aquaticus]
MTVTLDQHGTIAVVTIDNPPVNALATPVRAQLFDLAAQLDNDPGVSAVVLRGAGKLFVGGADITEFDRPPEAPTLPELINRIEGAKKPWIAAIHGTALGGGLELALGCHYRIATPVCTMGLPEVGLGFIPGAGGTQRLPRLIGLEAAAPVVAERLVLDGIQAAKLGLITGVVEANLLDEVIEFAQTLNGHLPPLPSARPLPAPTPDFWDVATARIAKGSKGQAAPIAALAAMRFGLEHGFAAGLRHERETFLRLRASEESAALRHLFFAERAAPRPAELRGTAPREVRTVGVVGGGTMGVGIAAAFRNAGFAVILSERDESLVERGLANINAVFTAAAQRGLITEKEAADRASGVTGCAGLEGLAPCDLVVEAVFEDLSVKRSVFAELAMICRSDALLATNTSYIDPRLIAEGLPAPERFIGLHFFSPAHVMKLLEIVPLPGYAPEVLATAFDIARRLGKVPVRSGICDGFIGNRILKRYRAEAENMLRSGVPHSEIDAAMRRFGFAMGPFEMQDMAGLDISFMNREAARARGEDVPETPGDLLVRAGRKGIKTGSGWYDYLPGDRTPRPSSEAVRIIAPLVAQSSPCPADEIAAHLIAAMAAEGQSILDEGIAKSSSDIDLVQVHGYGFPRTKGGPMFQTARKAKS